MNISDYHSHEALGSSAMATLLKSAARFKAIRDGKIKERTKAMDLGSALHLYVLEPDKFDESVIIEDTPIPQEIKTLVESGVDLAEYPPHLLTKSGALSASKAAKEEIEKLDKSYYYLTPSKYRLSKIYKEYLGGKIVISSADFELIRRMAAKLSDLELFAEWIDAAKKERSFFGEIDGVEVKCRPDALVQLKDGSYLVIDIKTASEADPESFAKSTANYLYYLQEALYREVLRQNGIKVKDFVFAVTSKSDGSGAAYFRHSANALSEGYRLIERAIFKYKWCRDHDIWLDGEFDYENGGFKKVAEIELPMYAYYRF